MKIVGCENGGTLVVDISGISCICLPEFGGDHCEHCRTDNQVL